MQSVTATTDRLAPPEWTNFLEVRAYGLMRSGNHAIIEWVQHQHAGRTICFLNNVEHGDRDPHCSYSQRVLVGVAAPVDVEVLRTMKKHLLLYSYEDRQELEYDSRNFLESVFRPEFERHRQQYLGVSAHRFDLSIIRDPFNCLASRLQLLRVRGPQGGVSDLTLVAQNWKVLAREALNLTRDPQPGRIVASFNRWVADDAYRENLSRLLMGTFTDASMDNEPTYAGGSSFRDTDRLTLRMIAARWHELFNAERYARLGHYWRRVTAPDKTKSVFERWKQLEGDDTFRESFRDGELLSLSEELFGEIEGTRRFVDSLK